MPENKIILLARDCDTSAIVYNYLEKHTEIDTVIFEKIISKGKQFRNRVKLLGFFSAVSQVFFMLFVVPFIRLISNKRKKEIYKKYSLDETPIPEGKLIRVNSLNTDESRQLLRQLNPSLILVNGTRILSKKTLGCVTAPFVNIHTGITPAFRGVHGGYWAIASGNRNLFGATIHYVDAGVDTGSIIEQAFGIPSQNDTFCTYPYLQYAVVLPGLQKVISLFEAGSKPPIKQPITDKSTLWFHPTLLQWLKNLSRTFTIGFLFSCIPYFS